VRQMYSTTYCSLFSRSHDTTRPTTRHTTGGTEFLLSLNPTEDCAHVGEWHSSFEDCSYIKVLARSLKNRPPSLSLPLSLGLTAPLNVQCGLGLKTSIGLQVPNASPSLLSLLLTHACVSHTALVVLLCDVARLQVPKERNARRRRQAGDSLVPHQFAHRLGGRKPTTPPARRWAICAHFLYHRKRFVKQYAGLGVGSGRARAERAALEFAPDELSLPGRAAEHGAVLLHAADEVRHDVLQRPVRQQLVRVVAQLTCSHHRTAHIDHTVSTTFCMSRVRGGGCDVPRLSVRSSHMPISWAKLTRVEDLSMASRCISLMAFSTDAELWVATTSAALPMFRRSSAIAASYWTSVLSLLSRMGSGRPCCRACSVSVWM